MVQEKVAFWRNYANVDASTPYFYSPQSCFKWPQRYIYNITGDGHSHHEGYGGIHSNWIYQGVAYNQTYKSSDVGITRLFVRTESYTADFEQNNVGWSWWLKRMATEETDLVFADEVLFFDYPLALNKRWGSSSSVFLYKGGNLVPFGEVECEAKVVKYMSKYKVPDQLGLSIDLDKTKARWIDAEDLCPPGCLITELRLTFSTPQGDSIQTMEVWKDIRGCVPVQRTYINGKLMVEEIAEKWTGNIP